MSSLSKRGQKSQNGRGERIFDAVADFAIFRERISYFSLKYWAIRLSEVFEARKKTVLRGEAYAWTPVFEVFDKLCKVGVYPYLSFIIYLSALLMFELNEVVRSRLIGSKSCDRIVIIFETQMVQPMTVHSLIGLLIVNLCVNACFDVYEAGNGHEIRVH